MAQAIDPIKLKAAAEHLEWVLRQYMHEAQVAPLLDALRPLIEAARSCRLHQPVDRMDVPFAYAIAAGEFRGFESPDVEGAFVEFASELRGGRDAEEEKLIALLDAPAPQGERNG